MIIPHRLIQIPACIAGIAALLLAAGCRQRSVEPQVEFSLQRVAFQIGETKLLVQVAQYGANPLTMVNLHEDEATSVRAAHTILEKRGGRLIQLVHTGRRRVVFSLDGARYSFDPNRIYSEAGVRKTVRGAGEVPESAFAAVRGFADQFVNYLKLDGQPRLIALHNNGDGFYSIRSYLPGAEYEADAARVFVNPAADPDDFFYVTDERYFRELEARQFNVILQKPRIVRDDGSLSVFAGRRKIPYINVEAQNEHFDEQIRMLKLAMDLSAPGR